MHDLIIKNANLATPLGHRPIKGADFGDILNTPANIAITSGCISYVGPELPAAKTTIDAEGRLVTPGLVDCHTHMVFGGSRQNELAKKLAGADYLDILAAGGGILSTVAATRDAEAAALLARAAGFADKMLRHGTTTAEAKSGYGLDVENELKQLKVAQKLNQQHPIDIVCTFIGAHAVPGEYKGRTDAYVDYVVAEMIPAAAGFAEFCDIFCEKGVFDAEQSRRVLAAALDAGFGVKIHANEINNLGGAVLAAELGAVSAEHLIASDESDMEALAAAGVIGVLLPATSFYLGKPYADAKRMVEKGVAIAVASDFNPGSSPNFNLQLSMTIACLKYGLTPAQVLTAATLNAACAIGRGGVVGSVEAGKAGDIVIWDCPDLDYLFYRYGDNQARVVIKKGVVAD